MESRGRSLAVVTGASSGIGFELAKVLAKNGYDLVMAAENVRLEAARKDLADMTDVISVQTDLAEYEGVEKLWNAVQATGR